MIPPHQEGFYTDDVAAANELHKLHEDVVEPVVEQLVQERRSKARDDLKITRGFCQDRLVAALDGRAHEGLEGGRGAGRGRVPRVLDPRLVPARLEILSEVVRRRALWRRGHAPAADDTADDDDDDAGAGPRLHVIDAAFTLHDDPDVDVQARWRGAPEVRGPQGGASAFRVLRGRASCLAQDPLRKKMVDSADAIARAVGQIEAHARATESEPNEFSGRNLEASAGRAVVARLSRNIGLRPSVYLSFKAARKKPGELLDRADTNRSEERDTLSRDLGLAVDEYLATTGEHFHDAFHPIRQARNFFGFSSASLSGRGDEGAAEDATDVKPGGAKRKAAPAAKGKATPAAKRKAAPAAKGKATPAAKGKATPAAKGKATPAAKGKATPAAKRKATPAAKGKATPAKRRRRRQGAPAPEAKDGKAAKGGNPTGAKAEADAEAEAEAKAAAEARKKLRGFDFHGDYRVDEVAFVHEVQTVTTHFRAAESQRRGTFTLSWGGKTTAHLDHDASAGEVADAAFVGVYGNVGLLTADDSLPHRRRRARAVEEVTEGYCDVVSGGFSYEVQTVQVDALSTVSGSFKLSFEGQETASIAVDARPRSSSSTLEALDTIFTANVVAEDYEPSKGPRLWTVTYTHQAHTLTQGAQDASLMVSDTADLSPSSTAEVVITERIKGADAFRYAFDGLDAGKEYFARPGLPAPSPSPVASGTSLDVTWTPPNDDGGAPVLGYDIEWYSEETQDEVQVVTLSGVRRARRSSPSTTEADTDGLSGYFTLELRGETTEIISVDAPAEGEGSGKGFIEVSKGAFHQTGSSRLDQNDLVFVAGEQFRVRQIDYGAGPPRASARSLDDFHDAAAFRGANVTDAPLTTWAFGYEWTVTFAGLVGGVRFGQAPLKGTFALGFEGDATPPLSHDATAADVEAALEQLSTITDVVVARAVNNNATLQLPGRLRHQRGDAFGFYLLQADTNQGSLEATMDALDADLASVVPTFDISWDITDCGSAEGVNFCQLGVDEDSAIGTISCDSDPTNDCIAASIDLYDSSNALMSTADMETALNAMSYSGTQFMIDADGVGVNVTRARDRERSFATAYAGSTAVLTDAEVGVFYSDPSSDDGVSSACATSRVRSTDVINVDASAATWSSTLRSVATIESASDYLVVTAAKPLPGNGSYVGLYVDVEFLAQHGDLKPMVCDTSYLTASSDATSAYCNVTTLQDGSLADGDFSLTTYWPNERVAKPSPFNATGLRWNSPSDTMDAGGTFSVAFNGAKTEEMEWQEAADEVEYVIEKLDTIGDKVQLEFERPLSDGGTNLSHYLIEYDTSDTFSSPKVFDVSASETHSVIYYFVVRGSAASTARRRLVGVRTLNGVSSFRSPGADARAAHGEFRFPSVRLVAARP
ncbi:protein serine/threonine kinase [Aureococcus anophagefferens]|uniref:Protein serine/threonine kinase n=1 Tax=Aureococcus anophagefferens TaxID=44056 RepID=A0ABR1FNW6_AURAN